MAVNHPELIYCADGNARFAEIAINHGFTYGAQLPGTVYFHPEFVDQDWKKPDREKYMLLLSEYKPRIATVLDYERTEQEQEVFDWAEEAAQHVAEAIIIIPKAFGTIDRIPRKIGGKEVRLGYSVPTKHGGTPLSPDKFGDRRVHLLGGSPQAQRKFSKYMNVVSLDANMHQKLAAAYCCFFDPIKQTSRGFWPYLMAFDGKKWGDGSNKADAPYEAFRRSCLNIRSFWWGGEFIIIERNNQPTQLSFSFL